MPNDIGLMVIRILAYLTVKGSVPFMKIPSSLLVPSVRLLVFDVKLIMSKK